MTYEIQLQKVEPQTLASVRGRANSQNVGEVIVTLLNQVWSFIAATEMANLGLNVAIYYADMECPGLFFSDEGVPVEVGVMVKAPFESSGEVQCSAMPSGHVASTLHVGPYQKLPEAHAAIRQWSRENSHVFAGPNWEVYGHWTDAPKTDDANELRTEVLYLLKE